MDKSEKANLVKIAVLNYRATVGRAYRIKLPPKHRIRGFGVLINHGSVVALADDVYLVSEAHLGLLAEAQISYTQLD